MSMPTVSRWAEDAAISDEVRSLLDACAAQGPTEQDLARFSARMAPLVGLSGAELVASLPSGVAPADVPLAATGSGLAAGTGSLAKTASSSLFAKAMLSGAVALIGGGLWWGAATLVEEAPVPSPTSAPVQAVAPAVEPDVPAANEVFDGAGADVPAVVPTEKAALPERGSRRKLAALQAPTDELSLMAEAQAKRGQPSQLLRVLAQHERWYPQGMLVQEREVLAVEAWLSSGNLQQARKRAAVLEAKFPNSAHLPRIRRLLEKAAEE